VTVYRADAEQPDGARHRATGPTKADPVLDEHAGVARRVAQLAARADVMAAAQRAAEDIRAREDHVRVLEDRIRHMEDRARQAAHEVRVAELRLAEARDLRSREVARPVLAPRQDRPATAPRQDRAAAARDHELARMKAKFIAGETAGADLAERLRFAHRQDGKVSLDVLGAAVGYSKATLSKVFNGKMPPTWALVRKLGAELKVPQTLVMQEWLPLWIAADTHRQHKPTPAHADATPTVNDSADGTAAALNSPTGHTCTKCGSWVVDVARHTGWHMAQEPGGRAPDAESMGANWNGESQEYTLLREALGRNPEA
jgi:transcriptional regulator with XRE-family HTH domain